MAPTTPHTLGDYKARGITFYLHEGTPNEQARALAEQLKKWDNVDASSVSINNLEGTDVIIGSLLVTDPARRDLTIIKLEMQNEVIRVEKTRVNPLLRFN